MSTLNHHPATAARTPKISVTSGEKASLQSLLEKAPVNTAVVLFQFTKKSNGATYSSKLDSTLAEIKKGQVKVFYDALGVGQKTLVVVGLGEENQVEKQQVREATYHSFEKLSAEKLTSALFYVPSLKNAKISSKEVADAFGQVSVLTNYQFDKYISKEDSKKTFVETATLHFESEGEFPSSEVNNSLNYAVTVAKSTNLARDLANERSHVANPVYFAKLASELASKDQEKFELTILDEKALQDEGLNLLYSVGKSAQFPPRLVLLKYTGDPSSSKTVALVGKGITFDTGGLNLKGTNSIETMYLDKAGASAVLATMDAVHALSLKVNVVGVLTLAENAIDANSYKPHEIIYSKKGLSVLIGNTDAEGRLALADALTYVQQKYKPTTVIDIATLTGACKMALGDHLAGLFSNSNSLSETLTSAGNQCHERVWALPLLDEHKADLKLDTADLSSTGKAAHGKASIAAAFLNYFIDDGVEWAHLDVAGPAMIGEKKLWNPKHATGYGVRLFVDYLSKLQ